MMSVLDDARRADPVHYEGLRVVLDCTEAICGEMKIQGMKRKELAKKMKVSKKKLNTWLNGNKMTIAKFTEIMFILGKEVDLCVTDMGERIG